MKHVKKSVLLWYSPREMFDLVVDVASYPKFLPWCQKAEVLGDEAGAVTARLHLFILTPEARGMRLGQRLHDAFLGFARQAGFRRMVPWTCESHVAACAPYARNGLRLARSVPAKVYGQDVVDQDWEITL